MAPAVRGRWGNGVGWTVEGLLPARTKMIFLTLSTLFWFTRNTRSPRGTLLSFGVRVVDVLRMCACKFKSTSMKRAKEFNEHVIHIEQWGVTHKIGILAERERRSAGFVGVTRKDSRRWDGKGPLRRRRTRSVKNRVDERIVMCGP